MNKLSKFEYWVQRTLPQVYDDSLSFYELLNKVVHFLNEVIESQNGTIEEVERLEGLYQELKNHVDTFFTNLDVQEEINNKLDGLVQDGTLDTIINQNIFNGFNTKLAQLEQQLESVASGSPKGAYTTLAELEADYPNGASGIYVVTNTGYWYYWNGTSWVQGAIYQSTLWQNALTTEGEVWV